MVPLFFYVSFTLLIVRYTYLVFSSVSFHIRTCSTTLTTAQGDVSVVWGCLSTASSFDLPSSSCAPCAAGRPSLPGIALHFLSVLGPSLSSRLRGTINKLLLAPHTAARGCRNAPAPARTVPAVPNSSYSCTNRWPSYLSSQSKEPCGQIP
jgi:hypothetical protein